MRKENNFAQITIKTRIWKKTSLRISINIYSENSFCSFCQRNFLNCSFTFVLTFHFIPYGKCSRHFNCVRIKMHLNTSNHNFSILFEAYSCHDCDNRYLVWWWNSWKQVVFFWIAIEMIVTLTHGQSIVNTIHVCLMGKHINPFNNMLPISSLWNFARIPCSIVFDYLLSEKWIDPFNCWNRRFFDSIRREQEFSWILIISVLSNWNWLNVGFWPILIYSLRKELVFEILWKKLVPFQR